MSQKVRVFQNGEKLKIEAQTIGTVVWKEKIFRLTNSDEKEMSPFSVKPSDVCDIKMWISDLENVMAGVLVNLIQFLESLDDELFGKIV